MFRAALALACLPALPVLAQDFAPVTDRAEFLSAMEGRDLHMGLFSLVLNLTPDGAIDGSALGWAITGTWDWQDGYFCREMDWSGMEIVYDCQLVEVRDGKRMRFTERRGEGDSASFDLR